MIIRIPNWLRDRLLAFAQRRMQRQPEPDFTIGPTDDPYMRRWYIWRIRWLSCLYLHQVMRSDDDRALHDHPWASLSIILHCGYHEVVPRHHAAPGCPDTVLHWRPPGCLILRGASAAHRLVIDDPTMVATTLFLTGPRIRQWASGAPAAGSTGAGSPTPATPA